MSSEHKRPLLAFVAVFVLAIVVVAAAARSDALRHLVQEQAVDVVAATTLDLVGESRPGTAVVEPEVEAPGPEPVTLPAQTAQGAKVKGARGMATKADAGNGKAKGHAHAKAPGKAKGHAHAKAPGKAKGHAHAKPPGTAEGHRRATAPGKARGHTQGHGHHKAHGKGHRQHGH